MPAKSWSAKYFPDARARLVVHVGFEMADEFTSNTFPFRFTIPPASLDPSVPRPGPYLFLVAVCRTRSTCFWAQMLYNLCQPHLSAAHHLQPHLPLVPAKAVRPKDLLTEIDVPIGQTLRQDFFWKYGWTVSLSVEETVAHGTKLRAFVIWIFWVNGLNFTVKTDVKFN